MDHQPNIVRTIARLPESVGPLAQHAWSRRFCVPRTFHDFRRILSTHSILLSEMNQTDRDLRPLIAGRLLTLRGLMCRATIGGGFLMSRPSLWSLMRRARTCMGRADRKALYEVLEPLTRLKHQLNREAAKEALTRIMKVRVRPQALQPWIAELQAILYFSPVNTVKGVSHEEKAGLIQMLVDQTMVAPYDPEYIDEKIQQPKTEIPKPGEMWIGKVGDRYMALEASGSGRFHEGVLVSPVVKTDEGEVFALPADRGVAWPRSREELDQQVRAMNTPRTAAYWVAFNYRWAGRACTYLPEEEALAAIDRIQGLPEKDQAPPKIEPGHTVLYPGAGGRYRVGTATSVREPYIKVNDCWNPHRYNVALLPI